jgi:sulfonate transport system substrate-binding protein
MAIHIGAHPSNLTLTALAHNPDLQRELLNSGLDVHFHWYSEGRLIHDALDKNEINVVGTGSTRAIVAQADGVPLHYVAASKPRTTGAAILVRNDSPIHSPAQLEGRRVGLIDGSFHTYFLVAVADGAGIEYSSVKPVNWPVKDSLRALVDGEIDAWISMAPYLAPALATGKVRALIGCDKVIPNRSVFWIHEDVAREGRQAVELIGRTFAETDRWIAEDSLRAAKLFARVVGNVDEAGWVKSISARDWGLVPADATVLREQQEEADVLARHGLLKRPINLEEAVLGYLLPLERLVA